MFFWFYWKYPSKYPKQRKIWIKIRFIHETDKAILVLHKGEKIWIPKSRIYKVRLRKGGFEIYTSFQTCNDES